MILGWIVDFGAAAPKGIKSFRTQWTFVCLFVCASVCSFICPSIHPSAHLSIRYASAKPRFLGVFGRILNQIIGKRVLRAFFSTLLFYLPVRPSVSPYFVTCLLPMSHGDTWRHSPDALLPGQACLLFRSLCLSIRLSICSSNGLSACAEQRQKSSAL